MSRSGNGVEVRNTSIHLAFTSQRRVACRETIYQGREPLAPTPLNVRYAHRVAEVIRRRLRAGHRVKVLREVYSRWLSGADGSRFWETGREESRMKNRFGGRCLHCGEWVEPLAGRFRRVAGVLKLFHRGCKQ